MFYNSRAASLEASWKILKEGKNPSFNVMEFVRSARAKGYTFCVLLDGSLCLGISDVPADTYDTVSVECRVYKEDIKDYLRSEAA